VSGNVDRNEWNGTLEELFAFANGGPKYAAKFVSQSFPYASQGAVQMFAGEEVTVSLEMLNTGTAPWDEGTHLGTTEPRDRESPFAGPEWPAPDRYARVEGVVMPGETYTFTWTMHAPPEAGLYDEHMNLVQEGVAWFGDPGQGGPPDGQLEGLFEVAHNPDATGGSGGTGGGGEGGDAGGADGGGDTPPGKSVSCSLEGSAAGQRQTSGTGALFGIALGMLAVARRSTRRRSRPGSRGPEYA
jgi:hypothetical protein